MKNIILTTATLIFFTQFSIAQINKSNRLKSRDTSVKLSDSARLKSDIRSISRGRHVRPKSIESLARRRDSIPTKIDTAALNTVNPVLTPVRPNNPNPNNAQPSVVNPHPPATPPEYPIEPVNQKSTPKSKKKKN